MLAARRAAVHRRDVRRLRARCSTRSSCARARHGSTGARATRSRWPALAATRLFSAGGAGGLVLQAWALRRAGMRKRRVVADKTLTFLVLTYLVYMAALIVCGFGLRLGLFAGPRRSRSPFVPAIVALIAHRARAVARLRADRPRSAALEGFARGHGRIARLGAAAGAPARARRRPGCATRWRTCAAATPRWSARSSSGPSRSPCCGRAFHAFGDAPPLAVLVHGLLRRDARQPAAAAGRRSAGSTAA